MNVQEVGSESRVDRTEFSILLGRSPQNTTTCQSGDL